MAHFRTIAHMAQVDFFQDPLEKNWKLVQKLTPFKTITVAYTANHQKLTPFKTPVHYNKIDFMFICSIKLLKLTPLKTPALDYTVFSFSMGDTLQTNSVKSWWESTFQKLFFFRTILHSEFQIPFKTPVTHTSHSVNGLISRPFGREKEYRAHSSTVLVTFWTPFKTPHWKSKKTQDIGPQDRSFIIIITP